VTYRSQCHERHVKSRTSRNCVRVTAPRAVPTALRTSLTNFLALGQASQSTIDKLFFYLKLSGFFLLFWSNSLYGGEAFFFAVLRSLKFEDLRFLPPTFCAVVQPLIVIWRINDILPRRLGALCLALLSLRSALVLF